MDFTANTDIISFFFKSNNLKNFRDFRKHGVSQWFKTELKTELRSGGGSRDAV